jgi:hypothetical protein
MAYAFNNKIVLLNLALYMDYSKKIWADPNSKALPVRKNGNGIKKSN